MILVRGVVVAEGWWAPYESDRPQHVYSLSKAFTSTAVGLAQAEGLLSLEDRIVDVFADLAPAAPSVYLSAMRIKHLLTMTSGHDADPSDVVLAAPDWARAFLALPVDHEPGSHFVYNTAATYLLSAAVQRATGQRVLDYLTPRLFEPLGIEGATWEQSPQGADAGGFGLSVTTEDAACFAELYRCDGVWGGARLLPEGWAYDATAPRTFSTFGSGDPDWLQGYGYQFWRGRHGSYRTDGAFGQFALVLPDRQTVVATTAGCADMQAILDQVWTHLLPALATDPAATLAPDDDAAARLRGRLASLRVEPLAGESASPLAAAVSGRVVTMEPNAFDVESVVVTGGHDGVRVEARFAGGVVGVDAAFGEWLPGVLPRGSASGGSPGVQGQAQGGQPVAASAAWSAPDTLVVAVQLLDTSLGLRLTARFDGPAVRVALDLNAWFGPTHLGDLVGRLA